MVVMFKALFSTSNRFFFFITVIVMLVILYLIQQLADNSTIKMQIMSNYDKMVTSAKENISASPFLQEMVSKSNQLADFTDQSSLKGEGFIKKPVTIVSAPKEGDAIFYIDPPDKPIKLPKEKQPLVGKRLRLGLQDIVKLDRVCGELDQNHNSEKCENQNLRKKQKIKNNGSQRNQNHTVHQQRVKGQAETVREKKVKESDKNDETEMDRLRDELYDMKAERETLVEEWQKLREEKHKLLEDKIRFKKELSLGRWPTRDPVDLFYRSRLLPTNPAYWEGLNSTVVELRYPGILFSREYKPQPFISPSDSLAAGMQSHPTNIKNMTDGQAEDRFYQLLTQTHLDCGDIKRLGNTEDGGWDVCVVDPYFPKPGCIVYSFGINYDFSFDDSVAETFGCEVRAFDPSMSVGDHMHQPTVYFYQLGLGASNTVNENGWKLETMGSIMKKLKHLNKTIDIVKIDIEFNEWACLRTMMKEGVLQNIKQLMMEVHTPELYSVGRPSNKDDFYMMYSVLYGLERLGFRKFHFTYNPLGKYRSVRTGKSRSCCYEVYFVNIRYLKT